MTAVNTGNAKVLANLKRWFYKKILNKINKITFKVATNRLTKRGKTLTKEGIDYIHLRMSGI